MKTCVECHYYLSVGEGKNGKGDTVQVGNCFRYPPVINVAGGSVHPVVGASERQCGEFIKVARSNKA